MSSESPDTGFFQPDTFKADYGYWAKMTVWRENEVAALILGMNPNYATDHYKMRIGNLSYADRYYSLRDLVKRASYSNEVGRLSTPVHWLAWAKRINLPVPPELEAEVLKWDGVHGVTASAESTQIKQLETKVAELTAKIGAQSLILKEGTKALGARERETMLKIIIGMAVKGYSFDPNAARSDRINEIAGDIGKCGLSVSDDTVRRYLKEAAGLLPPQEKQER